MEVFVNYFLSKNWIFRIFKCFLSEEKQEHIIITKFRHELAFWGYDSSDMTDDELKKAMTEVGNIMAGMGFTMNEIADVIRAMATGK